MFDAKSPPPPPYQRWWAQVLDLKREFPSARVTKIRAHVSMTSVRHSRALLERKAGNDAADSLAKQAAAKQPVDEAILERLARVKLLAVYHWKFYGRLLFWSKVRGLIPHRGKPQERKAMRLRALPVHSFALVGGQFRCVRCFRVESAAQHSPCLQAGARPHRLYSWENGGVGLFCWGCGAWTFGRTVRLARPCEGPPRRGSQAMYRLKSARAGLNPGSRERLGDPRPCELTEWLIPLM